jgi:DNA-binding Lrp family transcriptional regulator
MDELDRRIVNALQGGFPICDEPYREVAERLGIAEAELILRLGRMLESKTLTRFGPMFQVERMGGAFVLAALAVPEADYERVAEQVNALPEVAHNYRREHALNMWFVLATETPEGIQRRSKNRTRDGFAGLRLPEAEGVFRGNEAGGMTESTALDADDRRLIVATQGGLPLVPRPYHALAEQLGLAAEEVMARLRRLLESGVIRRIGAVPNHYALGYTANGMSVWDVPDERIDRAGRGGRPPALRHPLLPSPARFAAVALQPVRHGARQEPRRGRGPGRADRRAARRRLPRPRRALQQPHPQEDRPAAHRRLTVSHLPVHAGNRPPDAARAEAQSARPGGDLEPDPPLQPDLQALLLDLRRQGLPRRAEPPRKSTAVMDDLKASACRC